LVLFGLFISSRNAYCSNTNFISLFHPLSLSDECGCFKEHSEVKKEALDRCALLERKETTQMRGENEGGSMPMSDGSDESV
jgi:hypothetical protein